MDTKAIIAVRNVTKKYGRGADATTAVNDISLRIHKGELLAVVGPSGSGKTTLTHILGGLIQPTSGEVLVDGAPLKTRSDKVMSQYRNEKIGFVFQSFGLIPYYTALENVSMSLAVRGVSRQERSKKAEKLLKAVGLTARAHHKSTALSGGERQRVAIARALASNPEVIIADEPTGSLDSTRGVEIMRLLITLCKEYNLAVVLVTHDLLLAKLADRIVHIRDGKLVKEVTK